MMKKLIFILLMVTACYSCEKEEELTGNIRLVSTNDNIIGANYYVYPEDIFINDKRISVKHGIVSRTTEISDLNSGNYVIYFIKTGFSDQTLGVQVTAGKTRSYNILFNK